jgi:MFS family permease
VEYLEAGSHRIYFYDCSGGCKRSVSRISAASFALVSRSLTFYSFGMSLVAPGATLLALDMFPEIRGVVASCQSATSTLFSALIAGVMSPLLSHSVLYLALGQFVCCCVSACLWSAIRYIPKQKN